jgi:hypothetical protein
MRNIQVRKKLRTQKFMTDYTTFCASTVTTKMLNVKSFQISPFKFYIETFLFNEHWTFPPSSF